MNEPFGHWPAIYSATAVAVGISTIAPFGIIASPLTMTQAALANSKFKLEVPTEFT